MENIYNYKTSFLTASFKDTDIKKGIVTGYFSAFGNKDSDGDVIVKGAFAKTIEDRGPNSNQPRIKHLLNHRTEQPIGKLLTLKEDDKGLYYESQIGKHTIGTEFIKMVDSDLITEHSIGFRTIKWEKDQNDESITRLTELMLWEGSSLTAWGANAQTPLTGMKQQEKETQIEILLKKQAALERFCRNSDVSDETIESLLLYNKQLTQVIIDLTKETTKPEPKSATLPDNKAEGDYWIDEVKTISSLLKFPTNGTKRNQGNTFSYQ